MTEAVGSRTVIRVREGVEEVDDHLVVEEPVEIRLDGTPLAVVMRTPGNDAELALGFCITEGIVTGPEQVASVEDLGEGRWEVRMESGVNVDPGQFQRNFYATSSCGVCGKASIDAIRVTGAFPPPGPEVSRAVLLGLPERLIEVQPAFRSTGGIHAAAAFTADGTLVAVREDVGRHNAVDKLVGHLAAMSWPLRDLGLLVSGRVSFEIVQKAAVAGLSLVCGVSAASTLAVELAEELDMTVVGFLRPTGFTLYTGEQRVRGVEPPS
ncbi:MAG TPA: formate dehydrogenase accessory sulfurtransferase FdhD [Acidimicrobiia bacterium]|nr:formate dehydrogenase accessory sulfurtransferase FdhD [Acidimicrobiia bacterium]